MLKEQSLYKIVNHTAEVSMKKYRVIFEESFIIEADSEEQAEHIGNDIKCSGDLDFQIEEVEKNE